MNIILIGFKKSGKTTLGKILSKLLNKKFIDIDDIINKIFKEKHNEDKNIFEIYQNLQEINFRKFENLAFENVKNVNNSIIATSGGCILNNNNLEILNNPKIIIYLKATKETLINRIKNEKNSIFQNETYFEKEYEIRKQIYEDKADMIFETNLDFEKLSINLAKKIKEKLNVE